MPNDGGDLYAVLDVTLKVQVTVDCHRGSLEEHTSEWLRKNLSELVREAIERAPADRLNGNYFYRPNSMATVESCFVQMKP